VSRTGIEPVRPRGQRIQRGLRRALGSRSCTQTLTIPHADTDYPRSCRSGTCRTLTANAQSHVKCESQPTICPVPPEFPSKRANCRRRTSQGPAKLAPESQHDPSERHAARRRRAAWCFLDARVLTTDSGGRATRMSRIAGVARANQAIPCGVPRILWIQNSAQLNHVRRTAMSTGPARRRHGRSPGLLMRTAMPTT